MMKLALALTALAALPLAAAADVTKEDIKKLVGAGISEEVILTFIRSNGPAPRLSADDVVELKQAGASERVLNAMMGTPAPAPAPQPEHRVVERVVERPVYYPQTTYVSTPTYYGSGSWCSSHYSYDSCGGYSPYYYTGSYYGGSYYNSYYGSSYCSPRYYYPRYYSYPSYGAYYSRSRSCSSRLGWSVGFSW